MAGNGETTRGRGAARTADMSWDAPDHTRRTGPARDWKKLLLVIGLGGLSWVATYVGMLELIEANMGELPLVHKGIIGFSVAMLMVMVVWLLDQMFSDIGWFTRILFGAGYIFLTVISVGFGFGFYWKVLESRSEASRSAESAIGQVQTSLHAAMTRLEQLQGTLDSLTAISSQKAETERNTGTSCPNSKPGDGPRRKMRDDDAARFKFASDFVKGRVGAVKSDIAGLDADLAKVVKADKSTFDAASGTRNEFMRNLGRRLDLTVTGFNAFRTDPQLKQIRADLSERSDKATFIDTKGGTYTCPDGQLTTALKGVVRAIDELPALEKPKIAAVEGSEAVIEAFRRLTATFYGALAFKLPPSPEELRELQKKAVQSVEGGAAAQAKLNAMAEQAGLSKRDYVPLAIALFVDLCLLLVSMKKPGGRLERLVPRMKAAQSGPVGQIMSSFSEVHRDTEFRKSFEVFRHVIFDFHGDYYAAVPLNAPFRPNPRNGDQRQNFSTDTARELLEESHLLGNLFASFEKEKIFTRVWSPLLTTRTIQKRLGRQGSKFANAEAFRVYRFKDGAWSEMILGAVMGAADRIEQQKRRRRIEEELFADAGPTLTPTAGVAEAERRERTLGAGRAVPTARMRDAARDDGQGVDGPDISETGIAETAVAETGLPAARWRDRRPAPPPPHAVVMIDPAATHDGATVGPAADSRAADSRAAAEIAAALPLKPRPANNNTAPSSRATAGGQTLAQTDAPAPHPTRAVVENVIPHPAVARPAPQRQAEIAQSVAAHPTAGGSVQLPSDAAVVSALADQLHPSGAAPPVAPLREPTVEVEARRETITYRVPVSEASMPAGLLQAMNGQARSSRLPALEMVAEPMPPSVLPAIVAPQVPSQPALEMPPADVQPFRPRTVPPPLPPAASPAPAASETRVIALPAAAAEQGAQAERKGWEEAMAAGWRNGHDATLASRAIDMDETRSMALRLRPSREG